MSPRTKAQTAAARDSARQGILRAALKVFAERGYHGATMAFVARQARVSYGLAYHYFRSKDALFTELVRAAYEGSYALFLQAKGAPGSPREKMGAMINGILGFGVRGDSALYFQMVIQAVTLERVPKAVTALNAKFLPLYSALLEEILQAGDGGSGKNGRVKGMVTCFLSLVLGLPIILERQPGAVAPDAEIVMRIFQV
jgi:AcrR family transcriptional regulator